MLERLFDEADDEFMLGWSLWDAWLPRLLERGEARCSMMRASDIVALDGRKRSVKCLSLR